MKISDSMFDTLSKNEAYAIEQADDLASRAAHKRKFAEELEEQAMQYRVDAEVWRKILDEHAPPAPAEEHAAATAGTGWCSCGLPGVPGMVHSIEHCTAADVSTGAEERLVIGREPYTDEPATELLEPDDAAIAEAP